MQQLSHKRAIFIGRKARVEILVFWLLYKKDKINNLIL